MAKLIAAVVTFSIHPKVRAFVQSRVSPRSPSHRVLRELTVPSGRVTGTGAAAC
jgi:hypothetical protein